MLKYLIYNKYRPYRLMVTTSPLHVENIGSNPIKVIQIIICYIIKYIIYNI